MCVVHVTNMVLNTSTSCACPASEDISACMTLLLIAAHCCAAVWGLWWRVGYYFNLPSVQPLACTEQLLVY